MPTWSCFIPGAPVGKGRPRVTARNGAVRAYTPKKTATWEADAAWTIRSSWADAPPEAPPMPHQQLAVRVDVLFSRPGRLIWKRREMVRLPHRGRPDADNLLKAACDALEKSGVISDDKLIWDARVTKQYAAGGEGPGVYVHLEWEL